VADHGANRATVAMRMALMMLEVSRQLSGFRVTVGGYAAVSRESLGPMKEAAKALKSRGAHDTKVVRTLGTTENPYPVITTMPTSNNADYQALHWAVERLKTSRSTQRAILYLADGQIWEDGNQFSTLMRNAQRSGISIFFMNLSGGAPNKDSMLGKLPSQDVRNFDDMVKGLKTFLNNMVNQL
jgi:hypothetical protein